MNSKENKIQAFPYPSDKVAHNPSIDYILSNYFPTLKSKVEKVLHDKSRRINPEFLEWNNIPVNDMDMYNLEKNKILLKNNLKELKETLGWKKPIVFLWDSCFTNDLFIIELHNILDADFDDYVDVVDISYQDMSKNEHIWDKLYENSIVILWWSFSDLEDVPEELFESNLANFIKKVHNNKINSKLIWICWGQQLISSIIGFDEYFSEKITSTYRGVAQFWIMPGELVTSINQVPFVYQEILNSITKNWTINKIQYPLTRTGHVDFNLLDSYQLSSASTITFLRDSITWSPIIWWTRNGNILWNQAHFEINYNRDKYILWNQINTLIPILQDTYWKEAENIWYNIDRKNTIDPYTAQTFYSTSLLSFSDSILKKKEFFWNNNDEKKNNKKIQSQDDVRELIAKLNFWNSNENDELNNWDTENRWLNNMSKEELLKNLDKNWFLRLSTLFDWKVNRWMNEANDILWLNLEDLINYHNTKSSWNYVIRDWWSWNWKLVDDIIKKTWLNAYWVSDFAYFDIYEALINLDNFKDIPRNLLKIFVQELIGNYKTLKNWTVFDRVKKSINKIEMKETTYKVSSMFTDKTYRFNDNFEEITQEDKEYLENNKNKIDELKRYINNDFYDLIIWYFENVLISDFNSLYIPDSIIKKTDFQVAIRSTCHVDWKYLEKILQNYVNISAKPWSIYIDNWVVRSDSWVPRISEYINLEKNNKWIKVYFIYDSKTSYITSAIILKDPLTEKKELEKYLNDWYILLDSEEINSCSFLKIERFFRELMIFTFKNLQFNHDKNKEIINFLKELSFEIDHLSIESIKQIIIDKINSLIIDINTEYNENYTDITEKDFEFYLSKVNEDIKELFKNWKIENPSWFNTVFERKN